MHVVKSLSLLLQYCKGLIEHYRTGDIHEKPILFFYDAGLNMLLEVSEMRWNVL